MEWKDQVVRLLVEYQIIKGIKDVCLRTAKEVICIQPLSMDVVDIQERGNYKDIKFISHTTEV